MSIEKDILATLAYFDIFEYPLNQAEVYQFLPNSYTYDLFLDGLDRLCSDNWVFKFEELYTLQNNYALVTRRRQGNVRAEMLLKKAEKVATFLSHFPFVRGVSVSGSLSKHFADKKSDIDFFIITEKNRLWIARTLMHFFKKLSFLFNKQDWFCMNYYVDEEFMQIKEKNIYTAIELVTLIPYRGTVVFQKFYEQNAWRKNYLPNHNSSSVTTKEARNSVLKRLLEAIFRTSFGDKLDQRLMNITAGRWSEKTERKKLNGRGIVMGMDATRHCAKPDPRHFQKVLVDQYEKKVSELLQSYEAKISLAMHKETA